MNIFESRQQAWSWYHKIVSFRHVIFFVKCNLTMGAPDGPKTGRRVRPTTRFVKMYPAVQE